MLGIRAVCRYGLRYLFNEREWVCSEVGVQREMKVETEFK
jgi:hypothetical protein